MTENEVIKLHIKENIHRISVIKEFLRTNPDADDKNCKKNIQILTMINGALEEIQQYRSIGTVEECSELASFKPVEGKFYYGQQLYINKGNGKYNRKKS